MRWWYTNSMQGLLRAHQASLFLLVVVTAALAGTWALFWQESSQSSLRLNGLLVEAQALRGDLYRQIKEITRLGDPEGRELFWERLYRIDEHFYKMRQYSDTDAERAAIGRMESAYQLVGAAMNRLLLTPRGDQGRVDTEDLLNPAYERWMTGDFEAAYDDLAALVGQRRDALQARFDWWQALAPWLTVVPLLLAGYVVWWVNRRVRRGFVQPIEDLAQATSGFGRGELGQRLPEQGVTEVRQLAHTLNSMAHTLEANRRELVERERQAALGALVPVIAHNIRNPLAGIRANAQLLDAEASAEEIIETGADIIEAADRLERWLGALLSYLHPLKLAPAVDDLARIVDAAIAALGARPQAAGVTVERSGSAPVSVDAPLLEQALHGLLANALEASARGGRVAAAISAAADCVQLIVDDAGPGMRIEPDPRAQGPLPTTKKRGTGLGIPFAYKVVHAHGGRIAFGAGPDGGTRVTVNLPPGKV